MPTERAENVAELLWRLKRADKLAPLSEVAKEAGFRSSGGGHAVKKCLKSVRRDWPHLQWWRAVPDGGIVEKGSEREAHLLESGVELAAIPGEQELVKIDDFDEHCMDWAYGMAQVD